MNGCETFRFINISGATKTDKAYFASVLKSLTEQCIIFQETFKLRVVSIKTVGLVTDPMIL